MLFSKKDLIKLVIPLIIEQLFAITIGMADSVMVSTAGEAAISGVSLVDTINLLLIYVFSALSAGGAVIVSQLIGRGDKAAARHASKQLMWVVVTMATFFAALAILFRKPILSLIFGSIEADVMKNALVYFLFTAMSYPFLGIYNAAAAIFRSMGNSRISMAASLVMNCINVCGNAVLIFVFHMGAAGAAIATLVSRIVGALLILALLYDKKNTIYIERIFDYKPDFNVIKKICAIGIPTGLENGIFQFGKVLTQSVVAAFGTAQIAANAVGNNLASFQYMPGIAIGLALVTVVGQCVGAGKPEQAKKYTKMLLGIAYALIAAVTVILVLCLEPVIKFYGLGTEAASLAKQLMISHSVAVCLIHPSAFAIANSFRAANDVKYPMIISITSMWIFRVGFSYLLGLYFGWGVIGVWCAMYCDWIFRACVYVTHFIRGKWLVKYDMNKNGL